MELTVAGHKVFAATGGRPFDPDQPSAILLHGAGMDRTVWSLQARYFAHHGRSVAAVDLPGHGRSEGALLTSVDAMADWIADVIDALGVEKVALAGHSMGGFAVLAAAARAPEKVRGLALLGIGATFAVHPELLAAAKANDGLAYHLVTSWGFGTAGHVGGHTSPGLWMMDGGVRLLERALPGALYADLNACDEFKETLDRAANVACPTLLLLGDRDRMTPPSTKQLADAITGCRTVTLEGCGHMLMIEEPDQTTDALATVL
jgi:pimeloyl-ACP methyl ester carboxylesterase